MLLMQLAPIDLPEEASHSVMAEILRMATGNYIVNVVLLVLLLWLLAWTRRSVSVRQLLLLMASYLFYSIWGLSFLSILIASSLLNFAVGSLLRRHLRVEYLWFGVALNVLLLGFFKYLPPIVQATGGESWQTFARSIVMPLGMSFWTFQALSYLFDVYLEEEVDPSLLEFCLYMAFWPTVISGPVCRLTKMLPQFRRQPVFSLDDLSSGSLLLLQGLFMKMFLAQVLERGLRQGEGVAFGFDNITRWGALDAWMLGIGFGFQLFFDFAGYSLMSIGVARLFGIRLAENFNRPFLSTTPADFWTRWHMSLSFWIRDYVFRPVAAVFRNRWWPYGALLISMIVFGLWHGAKWTFVIFGFYHGLLLVITRLSQRSKRCSVYLSHPVGQFLSCGVTFLLVSLGFVIFRSKDLVQALSMLASIFTPQAYLQFRMPFSFYVLVLITLISYFGFVATQMLMVSWRERYKGAIADGEPLQLLEQNRLTSSIVVGGVFDFLATKLWWWLGPVVVSISVLVGLALYLQGTHVAVTPFIYALF